jgi:hypothetical protein
MRMGGQARGRHSNGTTHPLRISLPGWEDRFHQCPGKLCLTWNRSISVKFNFFKVSHSLPILPDLGIHPFTVRSTIMWPFAAAAFTILPRLDPPMNTVLPVLCAVGGGRILRSSEGFGSRLTDFFVEFSQQCFNNRSFLFRNSSRIGSDTKGLILWFLSPPGRDRGAELV